MEAESENANRNSSVPKLPLKITSPRIIHYSSSGSSGMRTPPHHSLASIPFQWEEEPGKPRPPSCTTPFLPSPSLSPSPRCLELPPRLLSQKIKTSSPVTVLDGPYNDVGPRSKLISSSFRLFSERQLGSFDSSTGADEEEGELDFDLQKRRRGFFGLRYWKTNKSCSTNTILLNKRGGGRKEIGSRSFGYGYGYGYGSSSMDKTSFWRNEDDGSRPITNLTHKNGSFPNSLSKSTTHFWAAMYEGMKQVIPWKSKKSK